MGARLTTNAGRTLWAHDLLAREMTPYWVACWHGPSQREFPDFYESRKDTDGKWVQDEGGTAGYRPEP
jgi:hypothetical protein